MTNAERLASATRFGRVVLDSAGVTSALPSVLSLGSPGVVVDSPVGIAGQYQFGTASFGPPIGSPNVAANVIAAVDASDAAGLATTDGCSPFANAGAVAGKIALIERGTCGFAVKARNAAAAGALAAVIYNNLANAAAAPPGMANDAGPAVPIPAVSLARADGLTILGQLGTGVFLQIGVDPTVRAGADALGRARVYAPFPVVGGSSISHYDTVASRNLLMEPAINPDLTHNVKAPSDLTYELLRDFGCIRRGWRSRERRRGLQFHVGLAGDDRDRRHRHGRDEPLVPERMHECRPDCRPALGGIQPRHVRVWRGAPDQRLGAVRPDHGSGERKSAERGSQIEVTEPFSTGGGVGFAGSPATTGNLATARRSPAEKSPQSTWSLCPHSGSAVRKALRALAEAQ